MKKIWLVATKTYHKHLRSGTFLILTFGLPVLMLIAGAVPLFLQLGQDDARLGYVDQTGQLAIASFETPDGSEIAIDAYPNADAAQAALEQDHIDGYLVIPEGYFQGETPRFYGQEAPGMIMQERLAGFIR